MRLDVFVSMRLAPEYSRSQVARMIKAGLVTVNGAAALVAVGAALHGSPFAGIAGLPLAATANIA